MVAAAELIKALIKISEQLLKFFIFSLWCAFSVSAMEEFEHKAPCPLCNCFGANSMEWEKDHLNSYGVKTEDHEHSYLGSKIKLKINAYIKKLVECRNKEFEHHDGVPVEDPKNALEIIEIYPQSLADLGMEKIIDLSQKGRLYVHLDGCLVVAEKMGKLVDQTNRLDLMMQYSKHLKSIVNGDWSCQKDLEKIIIENDSARTRGEESFICYFTEKHAFSRKWPLLLGWHDVINTFPMLLSLNCLDKTMPFQQLSRLALYGPHGFYKSINKISDHFGTDPIVNPGFSLGWAKVFVEEFSRAYKKGVMIPILVEVGPGSGENMMNMLSALNLFCQDKFQLYPKKKPVLDMSEEIKKALTDDLVIYLIESGEGGLKNTLRQRFGKSRRILFADSVQDVPVSEKTYSFVIMNEIFDAFMPDVYQKVDDNQWQKVECAVKNLREEKLISSVEEYKELNISDSLKWRRYKDLFDDKTVFGEKFINKNMKKNDYWARSPQAEEWFKELCGHFSTGLSTICSIDYFFEKSPTKYIQFRGYVARKQVKFDLNNGGTLPCFLGQTDITYNPCAEAYRNIAKERNYDVSDLIFTEFFMKKQGIFAEVLPFHMFVTRSKGLDECQSK